MMRFALLFAALSLAFAAPAFGRGPAAITAAAPSALGPWQTCDVYFTGPDAGQRSPVFRRVPVALRADQQHAGLKVAASDGVALMLFAWHKPGFRPFWMQHVALPLSVAFIAPDGLVLGIEAMPPNSTAWHWSTAPIVAALEASTPLFAKVGVKQGAKLHTRHCVVPVLQQFAE